jgi:hypothetical protein
MDMTPSHDSPNPGAIRQRLSPRQECPMCKLAPMESFRSRGHFPDESLGHQETPEAQSVHCPDANEAEVAVKKEFVHAIERPVGLET